MSEMTKMLIDIDEDLLADLMRLTGAKTKKAAVADALEQARRRHAAREYLEWVRRGGLDGLADAETMGGAQR